MLMVLEGHIEGGRLIIAGEIALPDGTPVRVAIEVIDEHPQPDDREVPASADPLPGSGMWADRADMNDSVDWVNQQRDA